MEQIGHILVAEANRDLTAAFRFYTVGMYHVKQYLCDAL